MYLNEIQCRSCKETNLKYYSALDGDWKGNMRNFPKLEACKYDTSS